MHNPIITYFIYHPARWLNAAAASLELYFHGLTLYFHQTLVPDNSLTQLILITGLHGFPAHTTKSSAECGVKLWIRIIADQAFTFYKAFCFSCLHIMEQGAPSLD
ncbi:hypothetical protein [Paenibacillus sp. FSL L8-0641]|uniref:hypothetical protein n=1 Tax=Paenibacillus sp. FSL L8-0641 TaxID=2921605 RepID=UPI0030F63F9A